VKLALCLSNEVPIHEDSRGSRGIAPPCLTLALVGGEWSVSRLGRFTSRWLFRINSGVRLSPRSAAAITGLLYQAQMTHDGDCGAIGDED
jgi:hypothetical protein